MLVFHSSTMVKPLFIVLVWTDDSANSFCFYFSTLSRSGLKVCSYSSGPTSQLVLTPVVKAYLGTQFARQKPITGGLLISRLSSNISKRRICIFYNIRRPNYL